MAGALFGAYHHGVSVTDATWKAAWDARDTRDEAAKVAAEKAARDLEQKYQRDAEKVQADATQKLEKLHADAVGANSAADGLRDQVQRLLAAGNASCNTRASTGSAANKKPGDMLAILLKKSVQRNTELAETADQARTRGRTCEPAYGAITK